MKSKRGSTLHKPREQRTFGYDNLGVEIRVFKTAQNAGAANIAVPQTSKMLQRNSEEFGLVTVKLANNVYELEKFQTGFKNQGYSTNFVLMKGTYVLSYTSDIKKAVKFLKG
ncbi:MAG: hypothetical protein UU64_C0008G0028 [candidate division WWE3 bacterium GW2011_GWF2_41_45]|uniref:Uncharacterized protein n=2 Tax=Katanobacteria TaxID=422282 RepID=A0A0G0VQT3_UNCKA|nr:MAG: hypothetical protein UU55_C0003G0004 [candidate division WWE3 bacterium GW2011_GWC2_41_23]KKS10160.1 MAG: hypothetical protein UU64_C0008G0028 [candidate division WWE3 bacterium GW2011_GWF2_41_45]KKS19915.1 MAG: hypothetical protein UU79_C0007G0004 [candidate division WWE3 bacterium GW2011_GWE1_41_72]KKS28550.1 MAG: hypothetical protein UU90_C0024G0012 [candidate division WWE3 bacterium GW2011_GWD2_42_11]KKS50574.1 MAG: hypothetical protein UV16_C0008G0004 [candidate division WWE3 bacte